ncbi:MAG TPA: TetR family transcriptional regulator [Lapillicoccus sp.]|nr:TetR family transcriptional regulator [Lapillicoccus sp.]
MSGGGGNRRGRRPAGEDTRGRITEAARGEFADKGYEGTSLRGVARVAGVDPALVHHYFDSKADLFAQSVVLTRVNPAVVVDRVLQGPMDTLGERMVRAFLAVWDDPENQDRLVALVRAVHTNDEVVALVREFVAREIVGRVTQRTGVADAPLRGALAASQLIGLATARYVVRMPSLAEASRDDIARWLGPTLQRYLVEP